MKWNCKIERFIWRSLLNMFQFSNKCEIFIGYVVCKFSEIKWFSFLKNLKYAIEWTAKYSFRAQIKIMHFYQQSVSTEIPRQELSVSVFLRLGARMTSSDSCNKLLHPLYSISTSIAIQECNRGVQCTWHLCS